jgi:glycosyltransferase involved in cell wall biosynthesis
VPSRWPYGLDFLSDFGIDPSCSASRARGAIPAKALRKLTGFELWETLATPLPTTDAVICWDERVGVPECLRRSAANVPVITGVIWLTDRRNRKSISFEVAKRALGRAHKIWALSSAQLIVLQREFGLNSHRLVHLPFGIDADFFRPGDDPSSASEFDPGRQLVISAGNDRDRDYATLITAVKEVYRRIPTIRFEVATRIPVEVPEEIGVRHVNLPHTRLRNLYRASSVVAIATRPNLHVSGITAILEAMACGRPVVATNTAGMGDYIKHGENGLLVPEGDADAMSNAISELLLDPAMAQTLGIAGRYAVESTFNTAEQARTLAQMVL